MNKSSSAILRIFVLLVLLLTSQGALAQIKVHPDGVNVNSQDSTVVFLTFGPVTNYRALDACWCGDLVPAPGAVGLMCNPATIFGCLPVRSDLSTPSGSAGFTDIMSIPPSVSRRAYQAALNGSDSRFFYVRHFISTIGGPEQYVNVTCRMTGGGARTPFSLTDVKLSFAIDKPVLLLQSGEKAPAVKAEINYNGTGRLKGRWEVVLPGDEAPSEKDRLTEATLPIEERATQRRYTQLSTFNVLLAPDGKYLLPGPDVSRIPTKVEGEYQLMLRIEATDEKEGDSSLVVTGAGPGVVHSGAVAGFPLPVLRYYVGSGPGTQLVAGSVAYLPPDRSVLPQNAAVEFSWPVTVEAAFYRVEVESMTGVQVLAAVLPAGRQNRYRAPSWLKDKASGAVLRWRVVTLDQKGAVTGEGPWASFKFEPVK